MLKAQNSCDSRPGIHRHPDLTCDISVAMICFSFIHILTTHSVDLAHLCISFTQMLDEELQATIALTAASSSLDLHFICLRIKLTKKV